METIRESRKAGKVWYIIAQGRDRLRSGQVSSHYWSVGDVGDA